MDTIISIIILAFFYSVGFYGIFVNIPRRWKGVEAFGSKPPWWWQGETLSFMAPPRCEPVAYIIAVFLATFLVDDQFLHGFADHTSGWLVAFDAILIYGSVMLLLMEVLIAFYNRPKFLVPPMYRGQLGYVQRSKLEAKERKARKTERKPERRR